MSGTKSARVETVVHGVASTFFRCSVGIPSTTARRLDGSKVLTPRDWQACSWPSRDWSELCGVIIHALLEDGTGVWRTQGASRNPKGKRSGDLRISGTLRLTDCAARSRNGNKNLKSCESSFKSLTKPGRSLIRIKHKGVCQQANSFFN